MNQDLLSIDRAFTQQYRRLLDIQKGIKTQMETYPFDLSKVEITDAIVDRMDAFWYFHVNNNKELLNRKINTVASDFFTETCLLFLKCYFEYKHKLEVSSERSIIKSKNAIRPDISIWKDSQIVAIIELKVNDGWKRKTIMQHLEDRESQIKKDFPKVFFGVIAFWNFFDKSLNGWNTKYIGIKEWTGNCRTEASVENLILGIEKYI